MTTTVMLRTVTGVVHEVELATPVHANQLYAAAATALALPADRFKLVLRGATVARGGDDDGGGGGGASTSAAASTLLRAGARKDGPVVRLGAGDVLLVMPQRRAPSERLQRAAAEAAGVDLRDEEDDDAPLRFRMPAGAARWEAALARFLQHRCDAPDIALIWLFHVGPRRLLLFAAVLAGAKLASAYDLGPVYVLGAMAVFIFTHLGTRREGEASAYSVFNAGMRRLPGQLDADVIDQQIRRGELR